MNYISFKPEQLSDEQKIWWKNWVKKADIATSKILKKYNNGEEIKFNNQLWSELKKWLLEYIFHGKCAYCESELLDTEWGDADHYRPKGRVSILVDTQVVVVKQDNRPHSGYFWLAYDWKNLFPSCRRCNIERKKDIFPVVKKHVFEPQKCLSCDELDQEEEPLLLHPYREDSLHPRHHLEFDKYGRIHPKNGSKAGNVSIDIYNLNREYLVKSRQKAQQTNWLEFLHILSEDDKNIKQQKLSKFRKHIDNGTKEYSAAIDDYINLCLKEANLKRTT